MASSPNSLRDRQISMFNQPSSTLHTKLTLKLSGSIERMLNLNHGPRNLPRDTTIRRRAIPLAVPSAPILNSDGDPIWKVLVFDDLGRDVISSVLRVNDLRTWGVTMHMYVPSDKRRPFRKEGCFRINF